ncbi:DUF4252 domain-containing protein [Lutimonas sp.]|uniref:DUF4252 domain-containing protein n=1 Tax=Lutimonas sp. TaxID=1872403 RepID=UPI003D9BAB6E
MKRLLLLFVIVAFSSCAINTSFNSFYQEHEDDSEFSFGLSSSLVATFLPEEDLKDIKPLLKKAKHIRILVFSEHAEDKTEKFDKFINRSKFEKMIKVKGDNEKIAFFTLQRNKKVKEIVLEIATGSDLVLIGLKTNLKQADLDKIINGSDIEDAIM